MGYAEYLRSLFQGVTLHVEDLFFLESFQIKYLPDRVPKQEFIVLLKAFPIIHRYLAAMYPSISSFIDALLKENVPVDNNKTVEENCNDLLWEIADLIIYNKYPEVYDAKYEMAWDLLEIITPESLKGKTVIDAGAGPGRLAFLAAQFADTVFAVEPAQGFRRFIREKADKENVKNLFVVDGFLNSLPFPDRSIDVLMTSQAIGWNLKQELQEIERVLRSDGSAIHLFRNFDREAAKPVKDFLTSSEWKYECTEYQDSTGVKIKFHKRMSG